MTGDQPLTNMTWEGPITVSGTYTVPSGYSLTIKPGTVVEFASGASLTGHGTIVAEGQDGDSIYFKPDGSSGWDEIYLMPGCTASLIRCVIHESDGLRNL